MGQLHSKDLPPLPGRPSTPRASNITITPGKRSEILSRRTTTSPSDSGSGPTSSDDSFTVEGDLRTYVSGQRKKWCDNCNEWINLGTARKGNWESPFLNHRKAKRCIANAANLELKNAQDVLDNWQRPMTQLSSVQVHPQPVVQPLLSPFVQPLLSPFLLHMSIPPSAISTHSPHPSGGSVTMATSIFASSSASSSSLEHTVNLCPGIPLVWPELPFYKTYPFQTNEYNPGSNGFYFSAVTDRGRQFRIKSNSCSPKPHGQPCRACQKLVPVIEKLHERAMHEIPPKTSYVYYNHSQHNKAHELKDTTIKALRLDVTAFPHIHLSILKRDVASQSCQRRNRCGPPSRRQ